MTDFERDQLLWELRSKLGAINDKCDNIATEQTEIKNIVFGDGGDDKPGLRMRVDRLETGFTMMKWVAGTALGGVILSFVDFVWRKVQGH